MQDLGVVDLFGMAADLSGMTGDKSLLISTLVQKLLLMSMKPELKLRR